MKKLIIILAPLFLSGCLFQTVPYVEIQIAEQYCASHDGINYIASHFNGPYNIICNDGTNIYSNFAAKELLLEKSK